MRVRVILFLLMVVLTAVLLEVGSLVVYRVMFGRALSRADIQSRLVLEDPAATANPKTPEVTQPVNKKHILHPYVGYVANPGTYVADWEFSRGGQTTTVNEQGFPGPEPIMKRRNNAVNICIFGGSFAMNFYLDSRQTLIEELKKTKAYADKEIRITTGAMSGWKQPQHLLALAYFLSQGAEYDVVIALDGFNEIALPFSENAPAGVYPMYPRKWNAYMARTLSDAALVQLSKLAVLRQTARERRKLLASPPYRHSNFCLLLSEILDRKARSQIDEADRILQDIVNHDPREHTPEASGPRRSYDNLLQVVQESADLWERCSHQMDGSCRANGITYLHFLQPNQYVPDSKPMGPAEQETALFKGPDYGFKIAAQAGYPILAVNGRNLKRDGIHFTDLTTVFKDIDEPLYEDTCCHVNKRGNDLIARKIAEQIAACRPVSQK